LERVSKQFVIHRDLRFAAFVTFVFASPGAVRSFTNVEKENQLSRG